MFRGAEPVRSDTRSSIRAAVRERAKRWGYGAQGEVNVGAGGRTQLSEKNKSGSAALEDLYIYSEYFLAGCGGFLQLNSYTLV